MKRLSNYINPINHLGDRNYSYIIPFFTVIVLWTLSEVFAYYVAKDPMIVGLYAIYLSIMIIVYFAFRHGIRGGLIATFITIAYYFYIIYTRNYTGQQLAAGVQTTAVLAASYAIVALIIGWLKQTIDVLIEHEADEKKRLQAIIQQLPVGVILTDEKGIIQQTNKQLDVILGMKMPIGGKAGKDMVISAMYNDKKVHAADSPLAQVLASGKAVKNKEFTIDRPDGKKIFINVNASAIHNNRGKIIAAASIINDITQQKELERRKDDFVNMASHELKTPITSMKLYIDSLIKKQSEGRDERTQKTLVSVKSQTERLQELVNGLLDVSRLQTGKLNFSKEIFRLDLLVEDLVEELQQTTKDHTITYYGKTPVSVYADKFRIYQVVTNLLTNAFKYSPDRTTIVVRVKKSNGKAIVSVQDKGIGIAKEQLKKVFDRLYQVTEREVSTFPGLGMGLYISKEIIKKHNGTIWVESEKGKGSTFFFTLPLKSTIETKKNRSEKNSERFAINTGSDIYKSPKTTPITTRAAN